MGKVREILKRSKRVRYNWQHASQMFEKCCKNGVRKSTTCYAVEDENEHFESWEITLRKWICRIINVKGQKWCLKYH